MWPGKPLNSDFTVSRLDEFVKKELPSYGGVFGDHYTVRAFDQLMEKYTSRSTRITCSSSCGRIVESPG